MIPILYEDDDIVSVDKPEGIAAIPERDKSKDSLLTRLSEDRHTKLFVVHRLDKEVSGVILFAKNADAHRALNEEFFGRRVQKNYLAIVHGIVGSPSGVIDKPLREFGSGRVGVDEKLGKPSRTEFQVRERFVEKTLLAVSPLTGRRHQIRAHLYSIGHSIVGDSRYGDKVEQSKCPRIMLHAHRIGIVSPSEHIVNIEAPLPPSFQSYLDTLRGVVRHA
jgi:RluA family pseudouridine synthase